MAPITSKVRLPLSPVHVLLQANALTGLEVPSVAALTQIRAVDRRRLIKRLGQVDELTLAQVDRAIQMALGVIASLPPRTP
ncbi:MAG: type II toxin-antitoxin system PemK/MazF family toxin [Terriglobia bacterium]